MRKRKALQKEKSEEETVQGMTNKLPFQMFFQMWFDTEAFGYRAGVRRQPETTTSVITGIRLKNSTKKLLQK